MTNKCTAIDCSGYKHTQMLLAPHCGALFLRQQVKKFFFFVCVTEILSRLFIYFFRTVDFFL